MSSRNAISFPDLHRFAECLHQADVAERQGGQGKCDPNGEKDPDVYSARIARVYQISRYPEIHGSAVAAHHGGHIALGC